MSDYDGIGPVNGIDSGEGYKEYDANLINAFDARSQNKVMRMIVKAIKEGTGKYNDEDSENELVRLVKAISINPDSLTEMASDESQNIQLIVSNHSKMQTLGLDRIIQDITNQVIDKVDHTAKQIKDDAISELSTKVDEIEAKIKKSIDDYFELKRSQFDIPDKKVSFKFKDSNFSVNQSEFAKYDRLAIIAGSTHTVGTEVLDWHSGADDFFIIDDDGNSITMDADQYIQWYKILIQRAHE